MRRIIIILTFFLTLINTSVFAANNVITKDINVTTSDGFSIKAQLEYPKDVRKNYPTVVLLHSLGYSSEWWESLPKELLDSGYAVLKIDLRGHGKSVYNTKLNRVSWKDLTEKAYAKYPDDVVNVLEEVKNENKKTFFNDWAIVGSDIGANTAILAADRVSYKPKTIVLLSPTVNVKGLYVPVKLANLDVDILSVSGTGDNAGFKAQSYLKKFAQATFSEYTSEAHKTGMMMLKHDNSLAKIITSWCNTYFKEPVAND